MSMKILVIEDSQGDRKIIEDAFHNNNIENVLFAENADEGFLIVESDKPKIVVTDTLLPGESGIDFCRRVKDAYLDDIKVIIITGKVDAIDVGKAREAGADDYCVKTSDCEELVKAVKNLL